MFGELIGKAKKVVDETEQIDECFYAEVIDELVQGYKDKGLVGKAIAQADGNEGKFDSIYMKLRAKALQEKAIQSMKLEQTIHLLDKKKQENIKSSIKERLEEGYFVKLFDEEIENKGYTKAFLGGKNIFKKSGKSYTGKVDYKRMRYVLANENNEYEDSFAFELK